MSALELLTDLASHGVRVRRNGDRLRLEATDEPLTEELVERVRTQKAELLTALERSPEPTIPIDSCIAMIIDLWPEADRERFDERAAIREYDGGFDRPMAERAAFDDMSRRKESRE